jgi:ubiquinone/menaquinone biosynthesis C-methylase UbiE
MAKIYTTEITSEQIPSDNPIHQRLFKAYVIAENYVHGDVLEVGCGEGRGIDILLPKAKSFTAVDKIEPVIQELRKKYPTGIFKSMNIPPLNGLADNSYDVVVSFQVIEHIQNDRLFLQEIHRVLKPGGLALITTPNRKMSLSRNPWHIREYLPEELQALSERIFAETTMNGITGNAKVMAYYEQNKRSVEKPYELLNRYNRNKLQSADQSLVLDIHHNDYMSVEDPSDALDLLLIARK